MIDQQKPEPLNDDLIRQALVRDFDSIEAPPADRCWRQIEAKLQDEIAYNRKSHAKGTRYAALAAAALLLIVLSSIGIMQRTDLASPMVEEEIPARAPEEEIEVLDTEVVEPHGKEAKEVELFVDEQAVSEQPPFEAVVDPSPPPWQEVIDDNFLFDQAILLSAGDGPDYHGAIYHGEEEQLLWIKSKVQQEDTTSFILNLGDHIQAEPSRMEEVNGYVHFETAGQPGLAWHEDDHNQALVVMSGPVSLEQLESIAVEMD